MQVHLTRIDEVQLFAIGAEVIGGNRPWIGAAVRQHIGDGLARGYVPESGLTEPVLGEKPAATGAELAS